MCRLDTILVGGDTERLHDNGSPYVIRSNGDSGIFQEDSDRQEWHGGYPGILSLSYKRKGLVNPIFAVSLAPAKGLAPHPGHMKPARIVQRFHTIAMVRCLIRCVEALAKRALSYIGKMLKVWYDTAHITVSCSHRDVLKLKYSSVKHFQIEKRDSNNPSLGRNHGNKEIANHL